MTGRDRREDYRRARVCSAEPVSPSLMRIRFGGDELRGFAATGHADQRVIIALPSPGEDEPTPPVTVDGSRGYPDGTRCPELRSYTVRDWDPRHGELVVDFALHAAGVATEWARRARAGAVVYVHADTGWYRPPADTAWRLLVADLAGLPALARIVETLPAGARAHVLAEVPESADVQRWRCAADLSVQWLVGSGNGVGPSALTGAVRALALPASPCYVWSAAEAGIARTIRKHARTSWHLAASRFDIIGYWRAEQEAWLARYRSVEARMEELWTAGIRDGKSEDDVIDMLDDALEQAGL
ncbi:siderophore-interacting protein [Rugosimonospora africana]|uniref:Siderophore-interacting protein n=1 Tax=Rugosimonospora africana TaxID=556532 RepID=A0A8J3R0P3_9ACTN|nr:siderophore-interacting protein [Rugosimonospora africana]GIH20056.1 siderophore-interacting protein [Rugosimonospora africana]